MHRPTSRNACILWPGHGRIIIHCRFYTTLVLADTCVLGADRCKTTLADTARCRACSCYMVFGCVLVCVSVLLTRLDVSGVRLYAVSLVFANTAVCGACNCYASSLWIPLTQGHRACRCCRKTVCPAGTPEAKTNEAADGVSSLLLYRTVHTSISTLLATCVYSPGDATDRPLSSTQLRDGCIFYRRGNTEPPTLLLRLCVPA